MQSMSKTYNQLKSLEKHGKVSLRGKEPELQPGPANHRRAKASVYEISITAVAVMLLVLIALSTRSYGTMRSFVSQDIQTAKKLNEIEAKIDSDILRTKSVTTAMAQMGEEIDRLNRRIKGQMTRIEGLEHELDGQDHSMANIIKVKNDLLSRIAQLEEQSGK